MSRIDSAFARLRARDEGALVAFITAGDPFPTVDQTVAVIDVLEAAGTDILELGIPYSDPLADGPSIQAASQRALEAGVTPPFAFEVVRRVREHSQIPIILFTYYNPVLQYGLARFADEMAAVGADGVLLTDLPPEEADPWLTEAARHDLATIFLLAPTSTHGRIAAVAAKMTQGFVYCVSRTGVTGARADVPEDLRRLLDAVREQTALPLCVGFGISTADHVRTVSALCDGAVIGSALVDFLQRHADNPQWADAVGSLVRSWKQGTIRADAGP